MDNQIVDVQFEDGTISICQIIQQTGDEYIVSELICKRDGMCAFSVNTCLVTKLEDTKLFRRISKNVYESIYDSDEDYEMSSEDESDSDSDISLDEEED